MNNENYLAHHGIKGQKWGIRRYENPDGSLTEAGKARYGRSQRRSFRKSSNEAYRNAKSLVRSGKITKDSKQFTNAKRDKIVSKYGTGKDLYNYLKGNKTEKNSAIESSFRRRKGRTATKAALGTIGGLTLAAGTTATAAAITSALTKIGLLTIATGTTAGAAVIGKAIVDSEAGKKQRSNTPRTNPYN